jgi:hypothetical protein
MEQKESDIIEEKPEESGNTKFYEQRFNIHTNKYIFEFATNETELNYLKWTCKKINVNQLFSEKEYNELKQIQEKYSIDISLDVNDSEELVKKYYEKKGYLVVKTKEVYQLGPKELLEMFTFKGFMREQIPHNIRHSPINWREFVIQKGAPDFTVFNVAKKEIFFVEVKQNSDGLRFEQVYWMYCSRIPVRWVFVHEDFSFGSNFVSECDVVENDTRE